MSWTVVDDNGRVHVRAIIDPLAEREQLVFLIEALQKRLSTTEQKEITNDRPDADV